MRIPVTLLLAIAISGCANNQIDEPDLEMEKTYQTGSNIPRKRAAPPPMTQEEKDALSEAIRRNTSSPSIGG